MSTPVSSDPAFSCEWFTQAIQSAIAPLSADLAEIKGVIGQIETLSKKVEDQQAQINKLQTTLDRLTATPPPISTVSSLAPPSLSTGTSTDMVIAAIQEHERLRSLVIANLPFNSPDEDAQLVSQLFTILGLQCTATKLFRLRARDQVIPLLKVVLPSLSFKADAMRNKHRLSTLDDWRLISIRPSETLANRIELARLHRLEPKVKRVIFRDQIIKLSDRPKPTRYSGQQADAMDLGSNPAETDFGSNPVL
jgi:hypothetical protein